MTIIYAPILKKDDYEPLKSKYEDYIKEVEIELSYDERLVREIKSYVFQDDVYVNLYLSDETGEDLWAISIKNTPIWLNSFKRKNDALKFCKEMEWTIV